MQGRHPIARLIHRSKSFWNLNVCSSSCPSALRMSRLTELLPKSRARLVQLVRFLGFDRSAFWEFIDEEQQHFLCSVAVEGVEPPQRGPIPADLAWFAKELRAGRTVVIRSDKDIPAEAAAAAEYNRRAGIRSVLVVPLPVDGRVVAAIGFGAFRSTREWPPEFIARVTVIGEVMAQALVRKRSEAALRASEARWRSIFETSTLAISVFDQDLRYTATNPAFQAILGYTDDELRQLTPLDLTVGEERGHRRRPARCAPRRKDRSLRR